MSSCLHLPKDELKITGGDQEECEWSGGKELNLSENEIIWRGWSSPFNASPDWNMLGSPGMAETPGDPHGGWCWLDFFLPTLSWNKHSAERTRLLLLKQVSLTDIIYCQKNQPETPAAVAQFPQLPQAISSKAAEEGKKSPGPAAPCRCWGGKKTSTPTLWCCFTPSLSCQRLSWAVLELRHTLGRMEICLLK